MPVHVGCITRTPPQPAEEENRSELRRILAQIRREVLPFAEKVVLRKLVYVSHEESEAAHGREVAKDGETKSIKEEGEENINEEKLQRGRLLKMMAMFLATSLTGEMPASQARELASLVVEFVSNTADAEGTALREAALRCKGLIRGVDRGVCNMSKPTLVRGHVFYGLCRHGHHSFLHSTNSASTLSCPYEVSLLEYLDASKGGDSDRVASWDQRFLDAYIAAWFSSQHHEDKAFQAHHDRASQARTRVFLLLEGSSEEADEENGDAEAEADVGRNPRELSNLETLLAAIRRYEASMEGSGLAKGNFRTINRPSITLITVDRNEVAPLLEKVRPVTLFSSASFVQENTLLFDKLNCVGKNSWLLSSGADDTTTNIDPEVNRCSSSRTTPTNSIENVGSRSPGAGGVSKHTSDGASRGPPAGGVIKNTSSFAGSPTTISTSARRTAAKWLLLPSSDSVAQSEQLNRVQQLLDFYAEHVEHLRGQSSASGVEYLRPGLEFELAFLREASRRIHVEAVEDDAYTKEAFSLVQKMFLAVAENFVAPLSRSSEVYNTTRTRRCVFENLFGPIQTPVDTPERDMKNERNSDADGEVSFRTKPEVARAVRKLLVWENEALPDWLLPYIRIRRHGDESYIRISATAARTIGDEVACRSTEDESPRRSETMIYYLKKSARSLDRNLDVEGTAIESPNTALQALRTCLDLMDQIVRTEHPCQRLVKTSLSAAWWWLVNRLLSWR
ncbi:unnamed protein product [Amoebophrya sp. A25]|nr:unnamed protein product [Amoebophrya sp. A25]|eukprot:GSA25T00019370001.1